MEMLQQIVEARARETAPLAPAVEPLPQSSHGLIKELLQSIAVAWHSVIIVVTTELQVQRCEQFLQRNMATLLAPLREVGQRVPELLAGCSPLQMRFASAILSSVKLEPEEVKPRRTRLCVPAEGNHPALGGGQLKPELFQTMLQRPKEVLRFVLILERANEIVGVSDQACLAGRVHLDHFVKPQIQHVMQIHVG